MNNFGLNNMGSSCESYSQLEIIFEHLPKIQSSSITSKSLSQQNAPVQTGHPWKSEKNMRNSEANPNISEKNRAAIELLRSWREDGDEEEQRDTWECLQKALAEDRV